MSKGKGKKTGSFIAVHEIGGNGHELAIYFEEVNNHAEQAISFALAMAHYTQGRALGIISRNTHPLRANEVLPEDAINVANLQPIPNRANPNP